MSKFTEDTKGFFSNPKKRRTVMFVLLVVLIILLLLLISRCTYDISHGFSDVTDNYIGAEGWGDGTGDTTEPGGSSDTTEPGGDDTTKPSGGGDDTSDPEDTTKPADTTDVGGGGSSPLRPSFSDPQIKLRPLNSTEKVEFHTTGTIPGQKEEIFIEIASQYAKDRKLTFELDVTKDQTNWVNTELADVLILTLEVTNGNETYTKQGTFKELDGLVIDLGTLRAFYKAECHLTVVLDTNAGNEYINSLLEADFIWRAE